MIGATERASPTPSKSKSGEPADPAAQQHSDAPGADHAVNNRDPAITQKPDAGRDPQEAAIEHVRNAVKNVRATTDEAMKIMQELLAQKSDPGLDDMQRRTIDGFAAMLEKVSAGVDEMAERWEVLEALGAAGAKRW
ncbi:hypothetical protein DFJ73DRAFT_794036 [Zopfochytrium polystomum]|nr:hypothetical protein DFJ73DRAFT_794036 [Zopfochytrium polystomum]